MQTHIIEQTQSYIAAYFNFHNTRSMTRISWWSLVTCKAVLLCASNKMLRQLCPMQLGVEVVDGVVPIIERPLVAVKPNAVV